MKAAKESGLRLILITILLFGSLVLLEAQFAGGSGSFDNPYQVKTAEHLSNVRNHLNDHFIQIADIDLGIPPYNEGDGWETIGSKEIPFSGSYDGNGHTIYNLMFVRRRGDSGLFGYINEAEIKNIGLENVAISGDQLFGSLAGYAKNSTVTDSYATGNVSSSSVISGGLIARIEGGVIRNCWTDIELKTGGHSGGIAASSSAQMINCYSLGVAIANRPIRNHSIGGLVGFLRSEGSITASFATGNVIGGAGLVGNNEGIIKDSYAAGRVIGSGGFVGRNTGTIIRCYSVGNVSRRGDKGSLVGINDGKIFDSYWKGKNSGETIPKSGSALDVDQMTSSIFFENWDFELVWDIIEKETHPFLKWQKEPLGSNYLAPSGLVLTGFYDRRVIDLSWNSNRNAAKYNIYRDDEVVATVDYPADSWSDDNTPLLLFNEYSYYVTAVYDIAGKEKETTTSNVETIMLIPPFAGGKGTEENPWKIATAGQLDKVRFLPKGNFIQIADIDLSGWNENQAWISIANFGGSYDGNGFRIKNLKGKNGLFLTTSGAKLHRIGLVDIDIPSEKREFLSIGGLVGSANYTIISDSYVTGNVKNIVGSLGGIAGSLRSSEVKRCFTAGNLMMMQSDRRFGNNRTGGIAGYSLDSVIADSYSVMNIGARSGFVGGLAGCQLGIHQRQYQGSIFSSYFGGTFTKLEPVHKHYPLLFYGLANEGNVKNSYWNKDLSEISASDNGSGLSSEKMVYRKSFTGWDFDNVWDVRNGQTYPFLRWQREAADFNIPGQQYVSSDREDSLEKSTLNPELVFAGGSGTKDNPYLIETAAQLNNIRHFRQLHFKQTANLDLGITPYTQNGGWIPVGTPDKPFCGSFNGNNYSIKNLTIYRMYDYQGLFGYTEEAELTNIKLEKAAIIGRNYTGAIAGRIKNTTITDSAVEGIVSSFTTDDIKNNADLRVALATQQRLVNVRRVRHTGGIVGAMGRNCRIISCSSSGIVRGWSNVGGIAGSVLLYSECLIENSYSDMRVTGIVSNVDGIVGYNRRAKIERSHSSGYAYLIETIGGTFNVTSLRSIAAGLYPNPSENIDVPIIYRTK